MSAIVLALFLCSPGPSAGTGLDNLDFRTGTLAGWEEHGNAFYVTTATGRGPSLACGVCSSDRGRPGRTGLLVRDLVIPPWAREIRFRAYAACPGAGKDWKGDEKLDVLLAAPAKQVVPKRVWTGTAWQTVPFLLPRLHGWPREYCWGVTGYAGRKVQIILGDEDPRPGCHIFCSGFRILAWDESQVPAFTRYMVGLTNRHQLAPPVRYDSRHFTALSNADDRFTRLRLSNCEQIYALFFDHFRPKGFVVEPPPFKLMVAIFDSQEGFEAYLGQKMSPYITGMYHPDTNRLVVYDYGGNEIFLANQIQALQYSRRLTWQRDRYVDTVRRQAREFHAGANTGITMHEVAHQLSFNCGMLNRQGDVPSWLAEGLACYCESTGDAAWQGIGEPNPARLRTQADVFRGQGRLLALQELVASDRWLRGNTDSTAVLVGYAQSWALFHMLLKENPRGVRRYLQLIYHRRTADHRLTDFRQVFGADLGRLELRYREYMKRLVQENRGDPR